VKVMGRLGSDSEELGDDPCFRNNGTLCYPSDSPLANHVHGFYSFESSPSTLKGAVAFCQPGPLLDGSMILFVSGVGIEAAPDWTDERSPETYIGYRQAQNFASSEKVHKNSIQVFSTPLKLSLNHWGLGGSWNVNSETAVLEVVPGKIVFRFHSRDLNLVAAPSKDGKPVRFIVRLDGAVPGKNAALTQPRTVPVKFKSPDSISSSGKKVQS
jgi:hypothetical protein